MLSKENLGKQLFSMYQLAVRILFVGKILLLLVTQGETASSNSTTCAFCNQDILSSFCKCDGSCVLYRDCCESFFELRNCEAESDIPSGLEYTCRSVSPSNLIGTNLFWMVSSCPSNWSPDEASRACMSGNCASLNSSLPPVTDPDTGIVYANEYYAICNRVQRLFVWQANLACSYDFYVYFMFNVNITRGVLAADPTIFQTKCQISSFQMPILENISSLLRPCVVSISTCLDLPHLRKKTLGEISDEMYSRMVDDCENGFYDIVENQYGLRYRNGDCAACNGEELCDCEGPAGQLPPPGIPFAITLINLGGGQWEWNINSMVIMVNCPEGQAALGLECRSTLCPEGYVENNGICVFLVSSSNTTNECLGGFVALNVSEYILVNNKTVLYDNQMLIISELDSDGRPIVCLNSSFKDFLDCPSSLIQLNISEFIDLGNDTISYDDEVFAVVEYDDSGRPLICPPNTTTIVVNTTIYSYPEGYFILTYIGCSLSVIGSALILLTYGLFKSLRTLPSLILMNLSAAILVNNLLIIIGGPVSQAFPSVELCTTVAICLHFFFLSQFSWMTIMSFQTARTFYRASKFKIDSSRKLFLLYFVIGWSVPIAITAISIIVDFTTEDLVQYGVLDDGLQGSCWINHLESAIVSFVVPLVISFLINMICFFIVTTYICLAARSSSKMDKGRNVQYFRVNVATFSVTGLTWVFGFIALLAGTSWAWYPFIILNSTQGFVIFIAFVVTKRVLRLYSNLLTCCESRHTSSFGIQSKLSPPTPTLNTQLN